MKSEGTVTVRGPHGIDAAAVESTERWEHKQIVKPDGSSVEIEPVYCQLRLTLSDGRVFEAERGDFFDCLLALRRKLESKRLTLCVQGARRAVWASGMSRDMGLGWYAEVLDSAPWGEKPDAVRILDPAPCDEVATVTEQRAWYREWLKRCRP